MVGDTVRDMRNELDLIIMPQIQPAKVVRSTDNDSKEEHMRRIPSYGALFLLAMAVIVPVATTGCSARASGTVKGAMTTIPRDAGPSRAGDSAQQRDGIVQASN